MLTVICIYMYVTISDILGLVESRAEILVFNIFTMFIMLMSKSLYK